MNGRGVRWKCHLDDFRKRESVATLRKKLRATHGHDWRRAQMIMDKITSIVGSKKGEKKGLITPRRCSLCGYFGHTRRSCQILELQEQRAAVEVAKEVPSPRADVTRWRRMVKYWKDRAVWMSARVDGGCELVIAERASDLPACGVCGRCLAWKALLDQYHSEFPPPDDDDDETKTE